VVVYEPEKRAAARNLAQAAPVPPPLALNLAEQRALLDLAERSGSLTPERLAELAELPTPLVGRLEGPRATERLLGIASYIAGRH
jgi:hypothetical protein